MKVLKFKNFSDEDFEWKWDGVMHVFKAGTETFMEAFKVLHFANHFVDRELHKANKLVNAPERQELIERAALSGDGVAVEEILDANAKKEKRTVPKKEETFPGLKRKKKVV